MQALGTIWAPDGHGDILNYCIRIFLTCKLLIFKVKIGRTKQIRTADLYHVKVAL